MFVAVIVAVQKSPKTSVIPTVQYTFLGETANDAVKQGLKTFEQLGNQNTGYNYEFLVSELDRKVAVPETRFTLVPVK